MREVHTVVGRVDEVGDLAQAIGRIDELAQAKVEPMHGQFALRIGRKGAVGEVGRLGACAQHCQLFYSVEVGDLLAVRDPRFVGA